MVSKAESGVGFLRRVESPTLPFMGLRERCNLPHLRNPTNIGFSCISSAIYLIDKIFYFFTKTFLDVKCAGEGRSPILIYLICKILLWLPRWIAHCQPPAASATGLEPGPPILVGTCESEIFVRIESRIESAAMIRT